MTYIENDSIKSKSFIYKAGFKKILVQEVGKSGNIFTLDGNT